MPFELYLEEYELSLPYFGKRCDELRKLVLGCASHHMENEIWNEMIPPGSDRIQTFDKKVAFLKNYRREKLEGARFAPMSTLEKWYKKFYC